MKFTIVHTESLEYRFEYEADTPEQAMQKYYADQDDGKISYNRPRSYDCEDHVVLSEELEK